MYAFIARREGVRYHRLQSLRTILDHHECFSSRLVSPIAADLEGVTELRLVLPSALASIDFHALELEGHKLIDRFNVVYALDLPIHHIPGGEARTRDVIVADPDLTLPGSAHEGRKVQALLPASELWLGRDARRAKLLAQLPDIHRLHYAGHARFNGIDGIDSSLVFEDGELSVGEILTARHGPESVVLSACEAAKGGGNGVAIGFGLAHAFIAVGARSVIGSPRETNDESSRQFFEGYYAALQAGAAESGEVSAWRKAASAQRERGDPDWSAFRVLVP